MDRTGGGLRAWTGRVRAWTVQGGGVMMGGKGRKRGRREGEGGDGNERGRAKKGESVRETQDIGQGGAVRTRDCGAGRGNVTWRGVVKTRQSRVVISAILVQTTGYLNTECCLAFKHYVI